jgi:hypothetical protein
MQRCYGIKCEVKGTLRIVLTRIVMAVKELLGRHPTPHVAAPQLARGSICHELHSQTPSWRRLDRIRLLARRQSLALEVDVCERRGDGCCVSTAWMKRAAQTQRFTQLHKSLRINRTSNKGKCKDTKQETASTAETAKGSFIDTLIKYVSYCECTSSSTEEKPAERKWLTKRPP